MFSNRIAHSLFFALATTGVVFTAFGASAPFESAATAIAIFMF